MITKIADFESEESVFLSFSVVWQEKSCFGENCRYRENICEIGKREVVAQIGRVESFFTVVRGWAPLLKAMNWYIVIVKRR